MEILIPVLVLASIGLVFGIALVVASKVFYVKEDRRVEEISSRLPNANCGGCGYPGCSGFAKALVDGKEAHITKCRVAKEAQIKSILEYLATLPGDEKERIKE